MSLLPFWALNVSVALLSMQGQRALGFHQKYLNLCFEDEWSSNMFGMTWGWVIYDIIFIFGWTIPNEIKMINIFSIQVLPSVCLFQERNHISVRSVERASRAGPTWNGTAALTLAKNRTPVTSADSVSASPTCSKPTRRSASRSATPWNLIPPTLWTWTLRQLIWTHRPVSYPAAL